MAFFSSPNAWALWFLNLLQFCGSTKFWCELLWIHNFSVSKIVDPQNFQKAFHTFCGNTGAWFKILWIHIFLKSTLWIHKMALKVVWRFFGFDDTFVICNMLTFGNKLHLIYHSEELLDCWAAQGTGTLQHGWDQSKAGMWVTDLCTPLHVHGRCSTSGPKSNITAFSGDMHIPDAWPHMPPLWLLFAQVFDATARIMRHQTWVEGWWEVVKWWKWCSFNLCRCTSTLESLKFLWMNPLDEICFCDQCFLMRWS